MVKLTRNPQTGALTYRYNVGAEAVLKCHTLVDVTSEAARRDFTLLLDGLRLKGFTIEFAADPNGKIVERAVRAS